MFGHFNGVSRQKLKAVAPLLLGVVALLALVGLSGAWPASPFGDPQAAATPLADSQGLARSGNHPDFLTCWYAVPPPGYGTDGLTGNNCTNDISFNDEGAGEYAQIAVYSGVLSGHKSGTFTGGRSIATRMRYSESHQRLTGVQTTLPANCDPYYSQYNQYGYQPPPGTLYIDGNGTCYSPYDGIYYGPAQCPEAPNGYMFLFPQGTTCYYGQLQSVAASWGLMNTSTAGPASVALTEGETLALEWSCQPQKRIAYMLRVSSGGGQCSIPGVGCSGNWKQVGAWNLYNISTTATLTGPSFNFTSSSGTVYGSNTVTPPVGSSTYTLTCNGPASYPMSINVTTTANPSQVAIAPVDSTATEGTPVDTGSFRISRTGGAGNAAALAVTVSIAGTGTRTTDYTLSSPASLPASGNVTITIPAGAAYVDVTLTSVNDAVSEVSETVILGLVANAAYTIGTPSSATINLLDDDRTLTVNSSGATGVAITGMPATYTGTTNYTKTNIANGTSLTLTAPATSGSTSFSSWSGCDSVGGTGNRTCNLTMSADKTVTATYVTTSYNLTVNSSGTSAVSITGAPVTYTGTTNYTKTNIANGTSLTVTAPATSGSYTFSSWTCTGGTIGGTGNRTCTLTMSADRTVIANYMLTTRTLTINSSGATGVAITGAPSTYSGTTNYVETGITDGTSLTVTAPATSGINLFDFWTGCNSVSGTGNRICNVTMSADKTVTASYAVPATIDLQGNGSDVPPRVRWGTIVGFTWTTSNIESGTCTLKNAAGTTLATGDNRATPFNYTITASQIFTLTCDNLAGTPTSDTVYMRLVPGFMEI